MEVIDQATLAALLDSVVVLVNKISSYVDRLAAKKNGGDVYSNVKDARCQIEEIEKRLTFIESKVETMGDAMGAMSDKVDRFHRDMMEFREESRINAASIRSYLQGKKEGQTNGGN